MTRVVEGVLTIVKGLRPKERRELVKGLLGAGLLTEDEQDLLVIERRRKGRTRPLEAFVADMRNKGRLRGAGWWS